MLRIMVGWVPLKEFRGFLRETEPGSGARFFAVEICTSFLQAVSGSVHTSATEACWRISGVFLREGGHES